VNAGPILERKLFADCEGRSKSLRNWLIIIFSPYTPPKRPAQRMIFLPPSGGKWKDFSARRLAWFRAFALINVISSSNKSMMYRTPVLKWTEWLVRFRRKAWTRNRPKTTSKNQIWSEAAYWYGDMKGAIWIIRYEVCDIVELRCDHAGRQWEKASYLIQAGTALKQRLKCFKRHGSELWYWSIRIVTLFWIYSIKIAKCSDIRSGDKTDSFKYLN